jgi:hypothetical protein
MDARREAQFVVKTTGKARNDADVPYRRNPLGLSAIVEPNPNFGRGHAECLDRLPGAERLGRVSLCPRKSHDGPSRRDLLKRTLPT